ncbi:hypothetical protein [Ruegeria arenilitoris]|uniref:hypothetical protein n=1 Tax=Ruegeria arenilitoris TaxID=1173585 RepID=UPI00147E750F|nr:hypothetical protein [Ruegeria arenilitoris]
MTSHFLPDIKLCAGRWIDGPHAQITHEITYHQLAEMVESPATRRAKMAASWFMPSSYSGVGARTAVAQLAKGTYWALIGDIDKPDYVLADLLDAARDTAPGCSFLIYSTPSSTEEVKRWRVVFPLAAPLEPELYSQVCGAMVEQMAENGVVVAPESVDVARVYFAPTLLPGGYYRYHVEYGPGLVLFGHPLMARAKQMKDEDEALARVVFDDEPSLDKATLRLLQDYNNEHPLRDEFPKFGYVQTGAKRWRSPMQTSKMGGTVIHPHNPLRWVSHSVTDANSGLGKETNNSMQIRMAGGYDGEPIRCTGDAFDLLVHYRYGGNFARAIRDLRRANAGELGVEIMREHEGRREWAKKQRRGMVHEAAKQLEKERAEQSELMRRALKGDTK